MRRIIIIALSAALAFVACQKNPVQNNAEFVLDPNQTAIVLTPEDFPETFVEGYPVYPIVESTDGQTVSIGAQRCVTDGAIYVSPFDSKKDNSRFSNLTSLGKIKSIEIYTNSKGAYNDANVFVGKVPFQTYKALRAQNANGVYRYETSDGLPYFTILNRGANACRFDRVVVYYEREASVAIPNPTKHTVMSFNLRMADAKRKELDGDNYWDYRRDAVVRMINDIKPEVIGVQEEYLVQVQFLESQIGEAYARVGESRNPALPIDQHCSIYYLKDKFTLLDSGNFWSKPGDVNVADLGWDSPYHRIITWVKLQDKDGKIWFHFNHHAVSTSEAKEAATKGPEVIMEQIKKIAGEGAAVTISADYNASMCAPVLLKYSPFLLNARAESQVTDYACTYHAFGTKYDNNSVIDHILYTGLHPLEYKTITEHYGVPYISDHTPILFTFEY